jgi:hypothetical protein
MNVYDLKENPKAKRCLAAGKHIQAAVGAGCTQQDAVEAGVWKYTSKEK